MTQCKIFDPPTLFVREVGLEQQWRHCWASCALAECCCALLLVGDVNLVNCSGPVCRLGETRSYHYRLPRYVPSLLEPLLSDDLPNSDRWGKAECNDG